jgi:hypothetical protein
MPPPSFDNHPPTTDHSEIVSDTSGSTIIQVMSDNVTYRDDHILSKYVYENAVVSKEAGKFLVKPTKTQYEFKTETTVPRIGYVFLWVAWTNFAALCWWAGEVIMGVL